MFLIEAVSMSFCARMVCVLRYLDWWEQANLLLSLSTFFFVAKIFYWNVLHLLVRCFDATLVEIPVEVETSDHHYYHVWFFSIQWSHPFDLLRTTSLTNSSYKKIWFLLFISCRLPFSQQGRLMPWRSWLG